MSTASSLASGASGVNSVASGSRGSNAGSGSGYPAGCAYGSGCRVDVGADPRTWPRRQRANRPPAPDTIVCSDDEDLDLPPVRGFVRVSTRPRP